MPTQAPGWYPDPAGTGGQRYHDGQGWTGQVIHGRTRRPLGHGFAALSDWLGRMLFLTALPLLALTLLTAEDWLHPQAAAARAQVLSQGKVDGVTTLAFVAAMAYLVTFVVTGVLWMIWQYRLAMQAPVRLRRSPGWHVGAWFVPIMSLWRPRANIGNLWEAYHRPGETERATPWSFSLWWLCWLSPQVLYLCNVLLIVSATFHQSTRPDFGGLQVLVLAGMTASAFLARLVVRDLSWRALVFWSHVGA